MSWLCRFYSTGRHVCCVFHCGPAPGSRALLGELVMQVDEFEEFVSVRRLIAIEFVPDQTDAETAQLYQRIKQNG